MATTKKMSSLAKTVVQVIFGGLFGGFAVTKAEAKKMFFEVMAVAGIIIACYGAACPSLKIETWGILSIVAGIGMWEVSRAKLKFYNWTFASFRFMGSFILLLGISTVCHGNKLGILLLLAGAVPIEVSERCLKDLHKYLPEKEEGEEKCQ